jgi:hypothetical protein
MSGVDPAGLCRYDWNSNTIAPTSLIPINTLNNGVTLTTSGANGSISTSSIPQNPLGPKYDENGTIRYQGELLTLDGIKAILDERQPLTNAQAEQILASSKNILIAAANAWNITSPNWSVKNQCAEQRNALKTALDSLDTFGWSITGLGGAKIELLGIHWAKHNVLLATPLPGTKFQSFVIDPFKNIIGSPVPNVIIESVDQFRGRYPAPYSGGW